MAPNAAKLDVDFDWSKTSRCGTESPEIRVRNVPVGTKTLAVKLVDFDAANWNHGGGEVAYAGQAAIPPGALKAGYNGPCPPGGVHTYEFTVEAINDKGDLILGEGKKAVKFP
ncbi:MAG: phospholipid-binding protein [Rhodospirillales bacterium]|nr:phospholipid-binding protein [Rhodospirillales bacterium]